MAQEAQTWVNPNAGDFLQAGDLGDLINRTLDSLTTWLTNPIFLNGITVGNSTPPTYDPVTNTETAPAPTTALGGGPTFTIGNLSSAEAVTAIQSINFVTQTSGWAIDGNGNAEFNAVNIYGGLLQMGDTVGSDVQLVIKDQSGTGTLNWSSSAGVIGNITASVAGASGGLQLFGTALSLAAAPTLNLYPTFAKLAGPAETGGLGTPGSVIIDNAGNVTIASGTTGAGSPQDITLSSAASATITMDAVGDIDLASGGSGIIQLSSTGGVTILGPSSSEIQIGSSGGVALTSAASHSITLAVGSGGQALMSVAGLGPPIVGSLAPTTHQPYIQSGTFSGTTAAGGGLTITFPIAFPNACTFGIAVSNSGSDWSAITQTVAAASFTAVFITAAGVAFGSHAVGGWWFAMGN